MFKPKDEKSRQLHRLKIAQGHVAKVIRMVEDDAYCIDVLHQSQAVQKALKNLDQVIMQYHLETCAADAIKSGKSKKAIAEIVAVLKRT